MSRLVRCVFDVHVKPSEFQQVGNELNTRLARHLCVCLLVVGSVSQPVLRRLKLSGEELVLRFTMNMRCDICGVQPTCMTIVGSRGKHETRMEVAKMSFSCLAQHRMHTLTFNSASKYGFVRH